MDVESFVAALGGTNKHTAATLAAYRRELVHFRAFLERRRLRVSQVKPRTIVDYLRKRDPRGERRPATISRRLAVLSSYFSFVELSSNGRIRNPVRPVARPRKQPPRPNPVEPTVVARLLDGITDTRDRVLLRLFLATGLRLAELCSLNRDTIRAEVTTVGGARRVLGVGRVIGKGQIREREFFVDAGTLRDIHAYLQSRRDDCMALFVSTRRQRLSTRAVDHILRRWCSRLGLPAIHAHQLRSRFATDLDAMGVPLKEIAALLGHASLQTSTAYVRSDVSRARAAYFAAFETHSRTSAPREAPGERRRECTD